MNRKSILLMAAVAVLINIPGGAKAGKTSTSVNVTTIVHDYDASGTQLLMRSDDYNDPGLNEATYSAALDPEVTSDFYADTWFLNLYSQSIRTQYITPNDAINNSQPAGPPGGSVLAECRKCQSLLRPESEPGSLPKHSDVEWQLLDNYRFQL